MMFPLRRISKNEIGVRGDSNDSGSMRTVSTVVATVKKDGRTGESGYHMSILDKFIRSFLTRRQKQQRAASQRAKAVLRRFPTAAELIGCEVGVYRGEMSAAMLARRPRLRLSLVDSWEGEGQAYHTQNDSKTRMSCDQMEKHYKATLAAIGFATDRADVRRMRSLEAAASFPEGYFDFVFIDADHSYEGCRNDIAAWKGKVKPGGWLCGHDYKTKSDRDIGVIRAVDEFCISHGLTLETDANSTWFTRLVPHPASRLRKV
jgi:hypothetical protein